MSPCSIATMFAWNAVGEWFSFCVTPTTGQTLRQNLWPELKQPERQLQLGRVGSRFFGCHRGDVFWAVRLSTGLTGPGT